MSIHASLYSINEQIMEVLRIAEAQALANDGAIDDDLAERMDALDIAKAEKIEAIASYIVNLHAESEMLSLEAKRLAERAKSAEIKAAGLERYLWAQQTPAGSYGLRKIGYRQSSAVEVTCDPSALPAWAQNEKITITPNRAVLKTALERGDKIDGVHIVTRNNIQIK